MEEISPITARNLLEKARNGIISFEAFKEVLDQKIAAAAGVADVKQISTKIYQRYLASLLNLNSTSCVTSLEKFLANGTSKAELKKVKFKNDGILSPQEATLLSNVYGIKDSAEAVYGFYTDYIKKKALEEDRIASMRMPEEEEEPKMAYDGWPAFKFKKNMKIDATFDSFTVHDYDKYVVLKERIEIPAAADMPTSLYRDQEYTNGESVISNAVRPQELAQFFRERGLITLKQQRDLEEQLFNGEQEVKIESAPARDFIRKVGKKSKAFGELLKNQQASLLAFIHVIIKDAGSLRGDVMVTTRENLIKAGYLKPVLPE